MKGPEHQLHQHHRKSTSVSQGTNNKIVPVAASLEGDMGLGIKFKETYIFLHLGESRSKGNHDRHMINMHNVQARREKKRERMKKTQLMQSVQVEKKTESA